MLRLIPTVVLIPILMFSACATPDGKTNEAATDEIVVQTAIAVLQPTQSNTARGEVRFATLADGVEIRVDISGAAPGEHGFHIHAVGDCSAPDGTSAGGHYAVGESRHGPPDASKGNRHAGDLGNLTVDLDGRVSATRLDAMVTLTGPESIRGKAVILHGGRDDLTTQPSGAAGPRIACGVIQ